MSIELAQRIRVNDTEIAYREVGHGRPLVLLHGGLVSASEAFAATPISYAGHLERLARTFRVIAPDTRAAGGTRHPGGPASATLLSDDVAALIEGLGLDRPLVAGFSEGGLTALLLGIRHPDAAGAIVSDAGYDMLNPDAPAFGLLRQLLGDRDPDEADAASVQRAFSQDPQMAFVRGPGGRDHRTAGWRCVADVSAVDDRPLESVARIWIRRPRSDHRARADHGRGPRPLLLCGGGGTRLPSRCRGRAGGAACDRAHHHDDQGRADGGLPAQIGELTAGTQGESRGPTSGPGQASTATRAARDRAGRGDVLRLRSSRSLRSSRIR